MAATAITGRRTISDFTADIQILQLDKTIHKITRSRTPFSSYLLNNRYGRVTVNSYKYHSFEVEHAPHVFRMGATESSSDTTINIVGAADWIVQGDEFLHAVDGSMERLVVTATPSADGSVAVTRGVGGSTANALTQGDYLVWFGNSLEEYNEAPVGRQIKEVESSWYLQNMRLSIEVTKPAEQLATHHGSDRNFQRQLRQDRFKQGMEMLGIFGAASSDLYTPSGSGAEADNGTSPYGSKGLDQFITNNRSYVENLTFAEIERAVERANEYHDGDWVFLCSPLIMRKINSIARDYMQVNQPDSRFGKRTRVLETTYGDIELVMEPLWTYGALSGYGVFVPKPIERYCRILMWNGDGKGAAPHWELDVKTDNSPTIYKDVMSGWVGYAFREQDRFAVLHGIKQ